MFLYYYWINMQGTRAFNLKKWVFTNWPIRWGTWDFFQSLLPVVTGKRNSKRNETDLFPIGVTHVAGCQSWKYERYHVTYVPYILLATLIIVPISIIIKKIDVLIQRKIESVAQNCFRDLMGSQRNRKLVWKRAYDKHLVCLQINNTITFPL